MLRLLFKMLPRRVRVRMARRVNLTFLEADPDGFIQILLSKIEESFDIEKSRKYDSAEEEVDAELEDFPELKSYRVYFVNTCRNLRIKNGLKR